jgi:Rieske Fe-S protein
MVTTHPEAVIEQLGRGWHLVYVRYGVMRYGPDGDGWRVFGAKRAERKARKELKAYIERNTPRPKRTIRAGEATDPHPWQEFNAYGNTCHHPGCTLAQDEHPTTGTGQ